MKADDRNNDMTPEQKPKKTAWIWMLLCCLAPILLIVVLAGTGRGSNSLLYVIALLACPLGMLAMMLMGRGSHCSPKDKDEPKAC